MQPFSNFLSINQRDLLKGLFIAALSAVIGVVQSSLQAGTLTINWQTVFTATLAAVLSYLGKNFLTNNKDEILKSDAPAPAPAGA